MGCQATIEPRQIHPPPVRFCSGEREVFRPRLKLSTFEWMSRELRLVVGSRAGQLWDPGYMPYMRGILDTIDEPSVRKVFVVGGSQSGKTSGAHGYVLASRVRGRGPAAVAMPDEKSVVRLFEGRLHKHIIQTPSLRRKLSSQQHALQGSEVKWRDGSTLHGIWTGSEASRSTITVEDLVVDEEDAYLDRAAVGITEERCTDYPYTSKIIRISKVRGVAGESTILRDMNLQADVIYHYVAACPRCGAEQRMRFDQIRVDKSMRDPARIRREKLARYECEHCGALWSDLMRDRALAMGRWEPDRDVVRPVVVGFMLWAGNFPRVSLSQILAEWFEAQGDPKKLKNFKNNRLSEEHKVVVQEVNEDLLLKLVDHSVQERVVPERALAVTLAADTQQDGFYYSLWAHAVDPVEDWVLEYGTLPGFAALKAMIFDQVLKREGGDELVGIWRAAVDTGGTRHEGETVSRTQQVYEWLLRQPPGIVFGTKGMSRPSVGGYVRWMDTIKLANGKRVKGIGRAYMLDVDYFKRLLLERLKVEAMEPIRLHEGTGPEYVRHFLAERLVMNKHDREEWQKVSEHNHYLDCAAMHLAMRHPQWAPALHLLAGGGQASRPVVKDKRKKKRGLW